MYFIKSLFWDSDMLQTQKGRARDFGERLKGLW